MSSGATQRATSARHGLIARLTDAARRFAWPLLNIYGIGVSGGGISLLALLTIVFPPHVDGAWLAFFVLFSASVRQLGFPIGGLTNSLFGIVDLMTLLLFGPIVAGWQSALAVLLHATLNTLLRKPRTSWTVFKLPLFNASVKAIMSIVGGGVYLLAGGQIPPVALDGGLIIPGFLLITVWFVLDYGAWSVLELFSGGRARFLQWTNAAVTSALMVEYLPLPFAFLGAAVALQMGASGLIMFAMALILASLAVRVGAQARRRLEASIGELTTLNHVSEEIIRASRSEQDICEIVYRYASQVVDTTYFLLGLLDDEGKNETLAVLVAEGERQESRVLPVGGVVTWMQERRAPLVVGDLRREALPFAPRQVGLNAGLVRSALFVPMLAGQELIGFMSIQSHQPNGFTADDTRILSAMANQAAMAIANIRLQRQSEQRERMERELRLASDIQRSLIPKSNPTLPGFEIASDWRSAREVSGDFFDFLPLPRGRLGLIIGDVSDKGVPAALFMALSRSLVRSGLLGAASAAEGLRRANRWIIKDTSSDMFLTLFYCVLDPVNQTLTYVNAGHNPPLVFYEGEKNCRYLDRHGIALGVIEDAVYEEHTISLCAGDTMICYTDGVTDAMNADGVPFGEHNLRAVAGADGTLPPAEIIARINQATQAYIGDEPVFDDATLIVVRCTGY
jgi:serine phosphatase RsbU (regulator of sigma subunit)